MILETFLFMQIFKRFMYIVVVFFLVIGMPVSSFYILSLYFGSKITAAIFLIVFSFITANLITARSVMYQLSENTKGSNKVGQILTEDLIDKLIISKEDLTFEEYTYRLAIVYNDHTPEGLNAFKQYLSSRVSGAVINYDDSPLPLIVKLLTLVDDNLPLATRDILSTKPDVSSDDEFKDIDLGDQFTN